MRVPFRGCFDGHLAQHGNIEADSHKSRSGLKTGLCHVVVRAEDTGGFVSGGDAAQQGFDRRLSLRVPQIAKLAKVIRSKNAGPFQLTIDLLFPARETFELVRTSGVIDREIVAPAKLS